MWLNALLATLLAGAVVALISRRGRVQARIAEVKVRDAAADEPDLGGWLQAVLDAIPEPIAVLTDELRFVAVNAEFARLAGADPDAVVGRSARENFCAWFNDDDGDIQRAVLTNGAAIERVEPWTSGDDDRLWRVRHARLTNAQGRHLVLTHACDVTDLTRTREAFVAQQDLAAVGSLTAPFAHGANNRLTVVLSCLDMIGTAGLSSEDSHKAVELANGAARRLADDMSALLAGVRRQVSRPQRLQLRESISRARRTFAHLPGPELTIVSNVPAGLEVQLDADRLERALLRLMSFARRRGAATLVFTGEEVTIEARTAQRPMLRKGHYCRLELELIGATLTERLLRASAEPGHVTDRLLDPDGLELAAVESFVVGLRGQLLASEAAGASPRIAVYLPTAPA
jgi:two-component system cell cycle sensor histidine kinase/response regulator CckA